MFKRLPLTALALGLAWAGLAQAQLVIDESAPRPVAQAPKAAPVVLAQAPRSGLVIVDGYDQPSPPVAATAPRPLLVKGSLTEVGVRPASVKLVEGWADGVPLSVALAQIVPKGFALDTHGLDTGSRSVSWSGNQRPWPVVLDSLAKSQQLAVVIRWDDHAVDIRGAASSAAPALADVKLADVKQTDIKQTDIKQTEVKTKTVTTTTTVVQPVEVRRTDTKTVVQVATVQPSPLSSSPAQTYAAPVAVAPVQTWRLDPAKTLKQNVEGWAKQAGWNRVVWEGADYPIAAPAVFSGRFDAQDGPLAQLIAGYADSDQPLLVHLTTQDRVIHVVNKNYTPAQVDSVSAADLAPATFNLSGNGQVPVDSQTIQDGSKLAPIRIDDRSGRAAHN